MKKLLVLGCLLAALVLASSAFAVTGRPARDVAAFLERYGINWSQTEHDKVILANCKGYGKPITTLVTPLHFHKLNCWVLTDQDPAEYKVRVIVLRSSYRIRFLEYTPGYWLS